MSVSNQDNEWNAVGDGTTTTFYYDNIIYAATDLDVFVGGVKQVLTSGYSVTGVGSAGGGSIVCTAAPADGAAVKIVSKIPATQGNAGPYATPDIMNALDRLTRLVQQNAHQLGRALALAEGDAASSIGALPSLASLAGKVLAFDANSNPVAATVIGTWRGAWATGTQYNYGDLVSATPTGAAGPNYYYCLLPNVASTFNADLAAGDWLLAVDMSPIYTAQSVSTTAAATATTQAGIATTAASEAEIAASSATASQAVCTSSSATAQAAAEECAAIQAQITAQPYGVTTATDFGDLTVVTPAFPGEGTAIPKSMSLPNGTPFDYGSVP